MSAINMQANGVSSAGSNLPEAVSLAASQAVASSDATSSIVPAQPASSSPLLPPPSAAPAALARSTSKAAMAVQSQPRRAASPSKRVYTLSDARSASSSRLHASPSAAAVSAALVRSTSKAAMAVQSQPRHAQSASQKRVYTLSRPGSAAPAARGSPTAPGSLGPGSAAPAARGSLGPGSAAPGALVRSTSKAAMAVQSQPRRAQSASQKKVYTLSSPGNANAAAQQLDLSARSSASMEPKESKEEHSVTVSRSSSSRSLVASEQGPAAPRAEPQANDRRALYREFLKDKDRIIRILRAAGFKVAQTAGGEIIFKLSSRRQPVAAHPKDLEKYKPIGRLLQIINALNYDDSVDPIRGRDAIAFSLGLTRNVPSQLGPAPKQQVVPKEDPINWQEFDKDPVGTLHKHRCPAPVSRVIMGYYINPENDLSLVVNCPGVVVSPLVFKRYCNERLLDRLLIDPSKVQQIDYFRVAMQVIDDIGRLTILESVAPQVDHFFRADRAEEVPLSLVEIMKLAQGAEDSDLRMVFVSLTGRINNSKWRMQLVNDSTSGPIRDAIEAFLRTIDSLPTQEKAQKIRAFMQEKSHYWSNVVKLNLSGLGLTTLPPEIGRFFVRLTELSLENNRLRALPDATGGLVNLTKLVLGQNQLRAIPNVIARLAKLRSLLLNHNELQVLPPVVARLSNLEELSLSNNPLRGFPDTISKLAKLTDLRLRDCALETLPDFIGNLERLRKIDFSANRLSTLPTSIGDPFYLESVDLGDNQLSAVPHSLCQLVRLTFLNLQNNHIAKLPDDILLRRNLKIVSLAGNPIKILSGSDLANFLKARKK